MKTQHTPGPWEIRNRPNTGGGHYIEPGIGEVYGEGRIPDANASLIAAAPDLLAILKPFIEIWEKGGADYADRMHRYWGYDRLSQARAAIAKAKGA